MILKYYETTKSLLQVLASLYKNNIQRLTKTFLTLSLADVASRVQLSSPAEAEKYILNMVIFLKLILKISFSKFFIILCYIRKNVF